MKLRSCEEEKVYEVYGKRIRGIEDNVSLKFLRVSLIYRDVNKCVYEIMSERINEWINEFEMF